MIKNRIESFAKYAGIATVSVEWIALFLYYIQLPAYFGGSYPISYFATLPQTRFIFTLCYTLAGIFFWIFIKHHIHKHYPVPLKLFGWSMILFIGLAIAPFDPNNQLSDFIHRTLGLSSSILLYVGFFSMVRRTSDRVVYWGTLLMLTISLVLFVAFLVTPKQSNLIFAFESGSWLALQLWVFWISFYTYKNPIVKF